MPAILPPPGSSGQFHPLDTHLELTAGDDALFTWYSPSFPDLAGATLNMYVGHETWDTSGFTPLTWTGTVPSTADSPSAVSLSIAGDLTADLPGGQYDYTLEAVLPNGSKVALAAGHLSVIQRPF